MGTMLCGFYRYPKIRFEDGEGSLIKCISVLYDLAIDNVRAMLWEHMVLEDSYFEFTMTRNMIGRKNKFGQEKKFTRRVVSGNRHSGVHPIVLLAQYRAMILQESSKWNLGPPKQVWLLPREKVRILGSADINKWLQMAAKETFDGLPTGVTPRSHRSGASTMDYRQLKDYPVFCNIADWE